MSSVLLSQGRKLLPSIQNYVQASRLRSRRAGRYSPTADKSFPLTYEMAHNPLGITKTKAWNSWNTTNLLGGLRQSETAVEDILIRTFIHGSFPGLPASEIIIKRQFNHIRVAFLMIRHINPTKTYFLIGYTEEILAHWMQCPITLEIQTIADREQTVVKRK